METGPVPVTVWEGPEQLADIGSGGKNPGELEMPWAGLIFTVHFTGITSVRMIDSRELWCCWIHRNGCFIAVSLWSLFAWKAGVNGTGSSSHAVYPSHRVWLSPPCPPPLPVKQLPSLMGFHWGMNWSRTGGYCLGACQMGAPGLVCRWNLKFKFQGNLGLLEGSANQSNGLRAWGQGGEGSPVRKALHPSLDSSSGPFAVSNTCRAWLVTDIPAVAQGQGAEPGLVRTER